MPQSVLTNLGVNFDWEEGDDGWKHGMDLNLMLIDAFGQGVVVSQVDADPWASISSPVAGKMYLVGTAPTGATAPWNTASAATIKNKLAIATGDNLGVSRWLMVTPKDGWVIFNQATGQTMTFTGTHGSGGYWAKGDGLGNSEGCQVLSMTTSAEPGSPAVGDAYIIAPTGSGANWSTTHDNYYARCMSTGPVTWLYRAPTTNMRVQNAATGEWFIYSGSAWVPELKYLIANSRDFKVVSCGNDGVGPFTADRAATTYQLTRDEASAQLIFVLQATMLGAIDFTNSVGGAITGNGSISDIGFSSASEEEVWTLLCTAGGATATFSVTGSVSGAQANATVGTPYDNGFIAFTLNDGAVDFSSTGNADKITVQCAPTTIEYMAADADVIPAMVGAYIGSVAANPSKVIFKAGSGQALVDTGSGFDLIQPAPAANACASLLAATYGPLVSSPVRSKEVAVKTANYTLTYSDAGKVIVMDTTGGNLTLTIPAAVAAKMVDCTVLKVFHKGGNTLTIAAGAGVTLVGTTAGTTDKFLSIARDGTSNTWYCG